MKYFRLVAAIGLGILVFTILMPWITVTFLGQFNISLLNLYNVVFNSFFSPSPSITPSSPQSIISESMIGILGILITILVYPISLILGVVSLAKKKVTLFAGVAGIISGVSWIVGVESLKTEVTQEASQSAGGLGGLIAQAASSMVTVGYGTYIAILGGVVILVAYFVKGESHENLQVDYIASEVKGIDNSEAVSILKMRLAKGEITKEEYEELKKTLQQE